MSQRCIAHGLSLLSSDFLYSEHECYYALVSVLKLFISGVIFAKIVKQHFLNVIAVTGHSACACDTRDLSLSVDPSDREGSLRQPFFKMV